MSSERALTMEERQWPEGMGEAAVAAVSPKPVIDDWPAPPGPIAFHGLAGEIVRAIEPHTEADPVGLLIQLLAAFGNVIGRGAHFVADGSTHFLNLFAVLVGETSKARKGTSWQQVIRLFDTCAAEWRTERVVSGLSSGEGLIWQVRDPIYKLERDKKTGKSAEVLSDAGIVDKRLLVHEPEFASVLRMLQRNGNTLSPIVRAAWESGSLRALTKNSPAKASGAHVSIVGHVVADELRRYLDRSEIAGGFANRFLWLCVRRSKCLPDGGAIHSVDFKRMLKLLGSAIGWGSEYHRLDRDENARSIWHSVYPALSEGKPGLAGGNASEG